jgi:hypothetical protein
MNNYKQNNYDSTDDNYIPSTDDIYNLLMTHPEYSKNIKKAKRSIIVYSDISPKKSKERKDKLREILKYIKGEEKLNRRLRKITVYDETTSDSVDGISSSIGRVEIIRTGSGSKSIVIFLKPLPKKWTDIKWRLNEEMLSDIATEYAGYSEENGKFLNIVITDGSKKIYINKVKSIVRVGGQNKKSDIKISSITGTTNISLKLPQFNSWQSSANSDDSAVKNAKKVLKNLPNFTAAFQNNNGVYVESTRDEVMKFCFGGTGDNKVDYIIVSNFPGKQLAKSFIFDGMQTLTIKVDNIYDIKKQPDILAIQSNCHMLIKKTNNSNANITSEYKGYIISFVPKSLTQYAIPGKR